MLLYIMHCAKSHLLKMPAQPEDSHYQAKCIIQDAISDAIRQVNDRHYPFRAALDGDSSEEKRRPFSSLQTDVSIQAYSLVFTNLVFFALNLRTADYQLVATKMIIDDTFLTPNRTAIFKLLHQMVTVSTTKSTTPIIPLFVRFSCCLSNGCLMGVDAGCPGGCVYLSRRRKSHGSIDAYKALCRAGSFQCILMPN